MRRAGAACYPPNGAELGGGAVHVAAELRRWRAVRTGQRWPPIGRRLRADRGEAAELASAPNRKRPAGTWPRSERQSAPRVRTGAATGAAGHWGKAGAAVACGAGMAEGFEGLTG